MIDKALEIVTKVYKGKLDKSGKPSILHPICIATNFIENEKQFVCALLHDTVEDGLITETELSSQFPKEVVDTVLTLTRKKEQSYFEYIQSIIDSGDQDAIMIKLSDLRHNIKRNRGKFPDLLKRHLKAELMITNYLNCW